MTFDAAMQLQSGDLVQVDPEADEYYGGCVGTVQSRRSTGIEVTFRVPNATRLESGRFACEHIARVGRLNWFEGEIGAEQPTSLAARSG